MSSKRQVTLKLTTQKELIKHESDARVFGELKKELKNVKWSGMRVVVRSTKNTLQDDNALLPGEDFVLFLVPEKVKSGTAKNKLKNIATASYNDLRSHASHLNKKKDANIPMSGGTEVLRKAVQKYYDDQNPAKAASAPKEDVGTDRVAAIEEARTKINEAIDVIIANAGNPEIVEDATEYLIKTSVDDLDAEILEVKKALNL